MHAIYLLTKKDAIYIFNHFDVTRVGIAHTKFSSSFNVIVCCPSQTVHFISVLFFFFLKTASGLTLYGIHRQYTGIIQTPSTDTTLSKKKKTHATQRSSAAHDPPPSKFSPSHHRKPSGEREEEDRPLIHLHKSIRNKSPVEVAASTAHRSQ